MIPAYRKLLFKPPSDTRRKGGIPAGKPDTLPAMRHLFASGAAILLLTFALPAQQGWWMREPLRWVQTNLREVDSASDPVMLVQEAVRFRANVLHINLGGIVATYPTQIPFHYPSRSLPPGRDFFGEALNEAKRRGIRVVGRFDLSKTRKEVYDAHPEWFFRQSNGQPVVYNGLYSTCINSGWYADHAMRILAEALERYPVDGLFFNMFGNQSRDYSGQFVGHCHCGECQRKFRASYGRSLPSNLDDPDYQAFLRRSSHDVAARIGELIRAKRPEAGYFNYLDEHTDGIMSESNTAIGRPLPLWPYTSSDNVNRARNSQPGKMAVNLCMQFVDFPWRYATVPASEITTRLWQNLAHGGALAFSINGTWEQQDRQAVEAARPVFSWAADHERYFAGQESAARVMLLQRGSAANYRGLFRLLSEHHIPFAVSSNLNWVGRRPVDLVVSPSSAVADLQPYVEGGGRLLVVDADAGSPHIRGYVRIRQQARFPSLTLTSLLMLNGPFTSFPEDPEAPLTLIPESMFGPPEYIHADLRETQVPALISSKEGRVLRLPFPLGAMYYQFSLPAHAALFQDLAGSLLPRKQLETDAHPMVEISLMRQPGRMLVHLVNLTGHSQTAWHPPLPVERIRIRVDGSFRQARALRANRTLPLTRQNGRVEFTLPRLADYELVELPVPQ